MARGVPETTTPAGRRAAAGEGRAHNRDRTGDLILTKDVLCRLSYVSDLPSAGATPKDPVRVHALSVDEFGVIGNPCSPRNHHRYTRATGRPTTSAKPPDPSRMDAAVCTTRREQSSQSGRRDSNPRHQAWKASALPTELLPRVPVLPADTASGPTVVREGFEPSKACADRFTVCSRWPLEYPTGALSDVPLRARLPSFERADGRD